MHMLILDLFAANLASIVTWIWVYNFFFCVFVDGFLGMQWISSFFFSDSGCGGFGDCACDSGETDLVWTV